MIGASPEKAGVGGSTPSLATIFFSDLRISRPLGLRPIASNSVDHGSRSRRATRRNPLLDHGAGFLDSAAL